MSERPHIEQVKHLDLEPEQKENVVEIMTLVERVIGIKSETIYGQALLELQHQLACLSSEGQAAALLAVNEVAKGWASRVERSESSIIPKDDIKFQERAEHLSRWLHGIRYKDKK